MNLVHKMEEYQEQSKSFSSENGGLSDAISIEEEGGEDEQFYEKIEAPKFVDFTVPDHYCPDDRYWFCLRVGCDQKHEEEMDSEAIYKNFVLRVMAARSPNVKLRRTLHRNASRTPVKCPRSAPPKSSKSRFSSRLAVISSISEKMVNEKSKVVRPLLKPESKNKTKPVAAKYLTTLKNKIGHPNSNSFRSVQNPKPTTTEISKSRSVAKTLVFHSPKKAIKVKTSVELRTPLTKLCEGMKRLEITSQKKKPFLGYSSKSLKNLDGNRNRTRGLLSGSKEVEGTAGEQLDSQACIKQETKSVRSVKSSKSKGKLPRKCVPKKLVKNGPGDLDIDAKSRTDDISTISMSTLEDASRTGTHCLLNEEWRSLEGSTNQISEEPNGQVNDSSNANELIDKLNLGSKNRRSSKDVPVEEAERNPSKGATCKNEPMDSDDKENTAGFDENRGDTHSVKQNGTKILGMQDTSGKIKKVAQAHENLQQDIVAPVLKFQKPKPTTPKPFRLRTDERMMHKEANLERKFNFQSPHKESSFSTILAGKSHIKEANDIQRESRMITVQKPLQGQEREKTAANATPQRSHVVRNQEPTTPTASLLQNNAIQRLEKFRKMKSPQQQHSIRHQGLDSTKRGMPSCLIPGQEMEAIHEAAVRAPHHEKRGNLAGNVRKPLTIGKEPNFHSTHVPRSCSTIKFSQTQSSETCNKCYQTIQPARDVATASGD